MAKKSLFQTMNHVLKTDALNNHGSPAYRFTPRHALAQYAATGCFNDTYYQTDTNQLARTLELCGEVDAEFVAKTALFARERGYMKDMPALLCAWLAKQDAALLESIFPRVIDNGKMLRNFVQMVRSGVTGRRSLGSAPRRMVRSWLESRSLESLFRASVGTSPSLADIVKMVHPKPNDAAREALYGYLIGRERNDGVLPALVKQYEAFKVGAVAALPNVPFQKLTALNLGTREWSAIARDAGWQMTRMNLNTFARHGVFKDRELVRLVADRLRNADLVRASRVFPYQLLVAYNQVDKAVPLPIREALQDALEIAIENVPVVKGKVFVFVDTSGSMCSPVTGFRQGATTAVRCLDVAGLIAAAIPRKNSDAEVIPFDTKVRNIRLNPRDSVMTNARKLAMNGGGTSCSAPLIELNRRREKGDLIIYVSDNESWADGRPHRLDGTRVMKEWALFKQRNPFARMVCLDLAPYETTQAKERSDIMNIGGFSDHVFELIAEFADGHMSPDHWVGKIEAMKL